MEQDWCYLAEDWILLACVYEEEGQLGELDCGLIVWIGTLEKTWKVGDIVIKTICVHASVFISEMDDAEDLMVGLHLSRCRNMQSRFNLSEHTLKP